MSKAKELLQRFNEGKQVAEANAKDLYTKAQKDLMSVIKLLHQAKAQDKDFATKIHDQLIDIYDKITDQKAKV